MDDTDPIHYEFWRASLGGVPGDINPNAPQCGYYRRKFAKGGGYVPLAVWRRDGELVGRIGFASGSRHLTSDEIHDSWTHFADNPISYEVYMEAHDSGRWPGEIDDPIAGKDLTIAEKVHATVAAAVKWLTGIGKIEGETTAAEATEWRNKLTALEKEAEAERRRLKRPHEAAAEAVDATWFPIQRSAGDTKKQVVAAIEDYGRRLKAEADRKAREENERRRKAAEEAEAERQRLIDEARTERDRLADEHPGMRFNSPPPEELIPPVVVKEVQAEPLQAIGGASGGRRTGFKTVHRAVITDWEAATLHYVRNTKLRELVQKLADADARAGNAVPGAKIEADIKAA